MDDGSDADLIDASSLALADVDVASINADDDDESILPIPLCVLK